MRKRRTLHVDWKEVDGAMKKKKVLRLRPNETGEYVCPVENCLHTNYMSKRGLRKHIDNIHTWYYYFDKQPFVEKLSLSSENSEVSMGSCKRSFSIKSGLGLDYCQWLQSPAGEGKCTAQAKVQANRAMRFLDHYLADGSDTPVNEAYADCCLGSPTIILSFAQLLTNEWNLGYSAAHRYIISIKALLKNCKCIK